MTTESTTPAAAGDKNVVKLSKRRARKATRGELDALDRYNESVRLVNDIKWPELNEPKDYPKDEAELAHLDFEAIPEFRSSGAGPGTPEFREQLEAYFHTIKVASRHAFAVLGFSRSELVASAKVLAARDEDAAAAIYSAKIIAGGWSDLVRLAQYLRAAEVRQVVAIVQRDMEAEEGNEPAAGRQAS